MVIIIFGTRQLKRCQINSTTEENSFTFIALEGSTPENLHTYSSPDWRRQAQTIDGHTDAERTETNVRQEVRVWVCVFVWVFVCVTCVCICFNVRNFSNFTCVWVRDVHVSASVKTFETSTWAGACGDVLNAQTKTFWIYATVSPSPLQLLTTTTPKLRPNMNNDRPWYLEVCSCAVMRILQNENITKPCFHGSYSYWGQWQASNMNIDKPCFHDLFSWRTRESIRRFVMIGRANIKKSHTHTPQMSHIKHMLRITGRPTQTHTDTQAHKHPPTLTQSS